LAFLRIEAITIDVDVGKIVIGSNRLNLAQRILQRFPVPESNVLECGMVRAEIERRGRILRFELSRLDRIQRKSVTCPGDIVFDVGGLASQLIWLNDKTGDIGGNQDTADYVDPDWNCHRNQQQTQAALR